MGLTPLSVERAVQRAEARPVSSGRQARFAAEQAAKEAHVFVACFVRDYSSHYERFTFGWMGHIRQRRYVPFWLRCREADL
jgi:hypothetical protein